MALRLSALAWNISYLASAADATLHVQAEPNSPTVKNVTAMMQERHMDAGILMATVRRGGDPKSPPSGNKTSATVKKNPKKKLKNY